LLSDMNFSYLFFLVIFHNTRMGELCAVSSVTLQYLGCF